MAPLFADISNPQILLVKTSSLGDVLHNLPVVGDIVRHYPGAQIDWIVEESFASLPMLHPAVRNVIQVAIRRWRGKLLNSATWHEISDFLKTLGAQHYDVSIDTQGLIKSALLMRGARGMHCGFDRRSAREPLATTLYQRTFRVSRGQHAVERNRQLAAQALGYTPEGLADYGIRPPAIIRHPWLPNEPYAVLLHATSRTDKLWHEPSWITLGRYLQKNKICSLLPWGSEIEKARSIRLAAGIPDAIVPPRLNLKEAASLLGGASTVIGVDTGLSHLAAALGVPTIGIYTATDPVLTGLYAGKCAVNLGGIGCAPDVATVIDKLQQRAKC